MAISQASMLEWMSLDGFYYLLTICIDASTIKSKEITVRPLADLGTAES